MKKCEVIKRINDELEGLYNYPEGESYLHEIGINYKVYKPYIHEYEEKEGVITKVKVKYPGGEFLATYYKEWGYPAYIERV